MASTYPYIQRAFLRFRYNPQSRGKALPPQSFGLRAGLLMEEGAGIAKAVFNIALCQEAWPNRGESMDM
jgi:hypothetical protein